VKRVCFTALFLNTPTFGAFRVRAETPDKSKGETNETVEDLVCGRFDNRNDRPAQHGRRPKEGRPETIRTKSDQKPAPFPGSATEIRR
jgi:hypothetical protein